MNAGHSKTVRSVSQARNTKAATSAKPSVIAMNASPNRDRASGARSPYKRRPNGSCNASSARRRNAAIPMSIAARTPIPTMT